MNLKVCNALRGTLQAEALQRISSVKVFNDLFKDQKKSKL